MLQPQQGERCHRGNRTSRNSLGRGLTNVPILTRTRGYHHSDPLPRLSRHQESPLHVDRLRLLGASINSDTGLTAIPWKERSNGQGHDTLRDLPLATKFIMGT